MTVMGRLLIAAAVAVSAGCFFQPRTTSNGITFYRSIWERAVNDVEFRAQIDLGPCANRQFLALQRAGKWPVVIGVSGCGTTAIYAHQLPGRGNRGPVITHDKRAAWTLVESSSAPAAPMAAFQ